MNFWLQEMLIFKLKIFEKDPLSGGRYEVLGQKSARELSLIVPQFILVEIELVHGGNVRRVEFLGQDIVGVDSAYPRVKQYLF